MIYVANVRGPHPRGLFLKGIPIYVGRPSALGNPYSRIHSDPIAMYEKWLRRQLKRRTSRASMMFKRIEYILGTGQEVTLLCWCKPKPCHADIIKKLLLENDAED